MKEKGRRGEGGKGRRGEGEKGRRGEGEKGGRGEGDIYNLPFYILNLSLKKCGLKMTNLKCK
jgi:hypothetical protein